MLTGSFCFDLSPLGVADQNQGGSIAVSAGSSSGTRTLGITFSVRHRDIVTHNGVANAVGVTATNSAVTVNYSGNSSSERVANFIAIGN